MRASLRTVTSDNNKRVAGVRRQTGQRFFQAFVRPKFVAPRASEHRSAEM
jgi:hypothetical protein